MKVLLLALFVAAVAANPIPDEDTGPVEMIVNGVAEGEALEIGHLVDIQLKEHSEGQVVATNLLHPFTAVGIAEAAAAAGVEAVAAPEPVVLPPLPEPVVLPPPVLPEVVLPEPVVLPPPTLPEVVIPQPIILPAPVAPEVIVATPEVAPHARAPLAAAQNSEVFNDGVVSVTINRPEDEGVLATLQSWLSVVLNFFSAGTQTSHQIV